MTDITDLLRQKGVHTNTFEFVTAMSILVIFLALCVVCVYDPANIGLISSHYVLIISEFLIVYYVFSCFFFGYTLVCPFFFLAQYVYSAIENVFDDTDDNQPSREQKSGSRSGDSYGYGTGSSSKSFHPQENIYYRNTAEVPKSQVESVQSMGSSINVNKKQCTEEEEFDAFNRMYGSYASIPKHLKHVIEVSKELEALEIENQRWKYENRKAREHAEVALKQFISVLNTLTEKYYE